MYIKVRLLNGWTEPLVYKIPDSRDAEDIVGAVLSVPLQKRFELALVESVFSDASSYPYVIKEVDSRENLIYDPLYKKFIDAVCSYYALDPIMLYRRLIGFLKKKEEDARVPEKASADADDSCIPSLTDEQQSVYDGIVFFIRNTCYQPCVLYGVTGSGKTEAYCRLLIDNALLRRTGVMLVPEVSLAIRFTEFFKKRFSAQAPVFGFHSATSIKEKRALWEHVRVGTPVLIIGVHLPLLLPLKNLGLIIVDEEHDVGYQEKKYPKLNSKEIALLRAKTCDIPVVLGSATPSIATLYNVEHRGWKLFEMKQRFAGAFPRINTIKLDPAQKRSRFWISKELEKAIADRLEKKEQILIFLNRRGHSFFVQCRDCGFIFRCTACSVALTYHENNLMRCHYCDYNRSLNTACAACSSKQLIKKGIGTQQVAMIIGDLFPQARVARADRDTTGSKKGQKVLDDFAERRTDILVGTQTITKGYHFPGVTLVGILWADMHLGMPVYNATEVTLQQLVQTAGRAGRQSPDSLVIIQTVLEHELFNYVREENYRDFYAYEIKHRTELAYPPCARFAEIELRHECEDVVERDAQESVNFLHAVLDKKPARACCAEDIFDSLRVYAVSLSGPARPPVYKIKNVYIRKIYLKSHSMTAIASLYRRLKARGFESDLFFTPNPLSL